MWLSSRIASGMALVQPSRACCPLSASPASNCRFSKMVHATFLTTSESSMTRQVFMLASKTRN